MLRYIILLVSFCFTLLAVSQTADSVVSHASLYVLPTASYQPETGLSGGISGGYYMKSNDISRVSSITGSTVYTLKNQFIFNVTPRIYFNRNKWYLYSNLSIRNYPDYYFGISNKPTGLKQSYTDQSVNITIQPQYILLNKLLVGCAIAGRFERVKTDSTFQNTRERIFSLYGSEGWSPYSLLNFGLVVSFDTRDNQFYPNKGFFSKAVISRSFAGLGSAYSVLNINLDIRHYIPTFKNHIFAWQFMYSGVFSKTAIPFQILPTVGGIDLLRGIRQGMYRQNQLIALQTEYRIPVYMRLKASVFGSSGDVFDSNSLVADKFKVTYGVGLRYQLNDARVHLRFDIARNNYGDKLQMYFTATEAF